MWFFRKPKQIFKEGKIPVKGGNVWYQMTGVAKKAPLIVLHGGPGFPHNYLRSLLALSNERPILFYDQLGCGRSDRPDELSLWTVARAVEELSEVIRVLDLKEYHLFGHSWGATLALEHALKKPSGLKCTIMASPFLSSPVWIKDANTHRRNLPIGIQDILDKCEQSNDTDSDDFKNATQYYYARHIYRSETKHPDYLEAAKGMGAVVYNTMWGPSEFFVSGNLKTYDRVDRLKDIEVPTLLTGGKWDEVLPATLERFKNLIPHSQMKVFDNSAHMPHLEETEAYIDTLRKFLKRLG